MQCHMDGSDLKTVLRPRPRRRPRSSSSCNCPELSVAVAFAVDHTQPQLSLYVAGSVTGDIWSLDEAGCYCQLIVNASNLSLATSDIGQ